MQRHELMAASVASAARGRGLLPEDVERLVAAYALGMGLRLVALRDDHDPRYLHPGRTVLVLLQDVGKLPVDALCAAAVHESEEAHLRPSLGEVGGSARCLRLRARGLAAVAR